jgi:hypothetical protein
MCCTKNYNLKNIGLRKKWVKLYVKDLFRNGLFGEMKLSPIEGGILAKAEALESDWG